MTHRRGAAARRRWPVLRGGHRGSAVVEFLGVSVLLLVPLVYLILTLARVQAATFAAEGAAREAGRIIAQAADMTEASARAGRAVEVAFADQGFDVDGETALRVTCVEGPCLSPGAQVLVEVGVDVDLPLVPDFVSVAVPAHVPVAAAHLAVVSEYREAP
ncbi:pilus assembly protein [Georgenia sp. AZ-5]|uniref:pilus assembly protein n=1 Tax=Georgenia sp. AZ-5 TaxID=3367526 RepID=UPI0037542E0F